MLSTLLPLQIMDGILQVPILSNPTGADMVLWKGSNNGAYTTASAYELLAFNGLPPPTRLLEGH